MDSQSEFLHADVGHQNMSLCGRKHSNFDPHKHNQAYRVHWAMPEEIGNVRMTPGHGELPDQRQLPIVTAKISKIFSITGVLSLKARILLHH